MPLLLDFSSSSPTHTLTHTQHTPSDCAPVRLLVCCSSLRIYCVCCCCVLRCPVRVVAGPAPRDFAYKNCRRPKVSDAVVYFDDAVTVRAKMQMMSRHHFAQLFRNCSIYLLLLLLMISEHKVCLNFHSPKFFLSPSVIFIAAPRAALKFIHAVVCVIRLGARQLC